MLPFAMDFPLTGDNLLYLSISLAVLVVIVTVFVWKFLLFPSSNYWESQNVPSHNPGFIQAWKDMIRKDLHNIEIERYQKYGKIYGRYDGRVPVLTVGDPDVLKTILVKDFNVFTNRRVIKVGHSIMDNFVSALNDGKWRRVRGVMTPTFTTMKLKLMQNQIKECSIKVIKSLNSSINEKVSADLKSIFGAFSLDVIGHCAFGVKINSLETPNHPFVTFARRLSDVGTSIGSILAQFFPFVLKYFRTTLFDTEACEFFRGVVLDIIEERKKQPASTVDFLHLLQEALRKKDRHLSTSDSDTPERPANRPESKYVTEDELIAQCVMFFFAGFETMSSLLQVTMYHLAMDQAIQNKLFGEINDILGDKDVPDHEDITSMKYLDAVISEALRVASSCVRMERVVKEDYTIEECGITLKRGQLVSLPYYCIHQDPENYPEPEKFDPERFTHEGKADRNPFTYCPFGHGMRSCIGNRFALLEAKMCLIMILKKFKVRRGPEMDDVLHSSIKLGQLVPQTVYVRVKRRS